jgi:hypothetical protein
MVRSALKDDQPDSNLALTGKMGTRITMKNGQKHFIIKGTLKLAVAQ